MRKGQADWRLFLYHLLLFLGAHIAFVFLFGIVPATDLPSGSYSEHIRNQFLNQGVNVYENGAVNRISGIWKSVLIVHLVWQLIETVFPRKPKKNTAAPVAKETLTGPPVSEERLPAESPKRAITSNRAWTYVIVAGALEIIWASGLKYESVPPLVVLIALLVSFDLIIKAVKVLPIGTAYAVFAGIGTLGTVLVEAVATEGGLSLAKVGFILLLLACVVGLKLTSGEGGAR